MDSSVAGTSRWKRSSGAIHFSEQQFSLSLSTTSLVCMRMSPGPASRSIAGCLKIHTKHTLTTLLSTPMWGRHEYRSPRLVLVLSNIAYFPNHETHLKALKVFKKMTVRLKIWSAFYRDLIWLFLLVSKRVQEVQSQNVWLGVFRQTQMCYNQIAQLQFVLLVCVCFYVLKTKYV